MSRRLSKLIFFAGVDEELEYIIGGTHRVYLVVVEKWLLRVRVMNKFKKMSHRNV